MDKNRLQNRLQKEVVARSDFTAENAQFHSVSPLNTNQTFNGTCLCNTIPVMKCKGKHSDRRLPLA